MTKGQYGVVAMLEFKKLGKIITNVEIQTLGRKVSLVVAFKERCNNINYTFIRQTACRFNRLKYICCCDDGKGFTKAGYLHQIMRLEITA